MSGAKLSRKELWEIGPITDAHYEKRKALLEGRLKQVEQEIARMEREADRWRNRLGELETKWELELWYRGLSPEEKEM